MLISVLLDKIPLGLIIFDNTNQIVYKNSTSDAIFIKTNGCLMEVIKPLVMASLNKKNPVKKIIKYLSASDFYLWQINTEIINHFPVQVLVIIQEITPFYRLKQTVLKAEKLAVSGQIAQSALVEIRNPLTSALGFCKFMEYNAESNLEYIKIISSELETINNILAESTSKTDSVPSKNLELLFEKLYTYISGLLDSYKLILIIDDFDEFNNLNIKITNNQVNTLFQCLKNYLDVWLDVRMEEDITITINIELPDINYLNFNIKVNFAKTDLNRNDFMKNLKGRNIPTNISDNELAFNFYLPINPPQSKTKSEGKSTKLFI